MVKRGTESGGSEVRRWMTVRSDDMFFQIGPLGEAGNRPATGGMGVCDGMWMSETRRSRDVV